MRFKEKERDLFVEIFIAFSQVTFGILWASILLPIDHYRIGVIVLNIIVTTLLVIGAWLLKRK